MTRASYVHSACVLNTRYIYGSVFINRMHEWNITEGNITYHDLGIRTGILCTRPIFIDDFYALIKMAIMINAIQICFIWKQTVIFYNSFSVIICRPDSKFNYTGTITISKMECKISGSQQRWL
jgi:hypothetical protein